MMLSKTSSLQSTSKTCPLRQLSKSGLDFSLGPGSILYNPAWLNHLLQDYLSANEVVDWSRSKHAQRSVLHGTRLDVDRL